MYEVVENDDNNDSDILLGTGIYSKDRGRAKKSEKHERNREKGKKYPSTHTCTYITHAFYQIEHFLSLVSRPSTLGMSLFRAHISTMLMLFHIFVTGCCLLFIFFLARFRLLCGPVNFGHIFSALFFGLRETQEKSSFGEINCGWLKKKTDVKMTASTNNNITAEQQQQHHPTSRKEQTTTTTKWMKNMRYEHKCSK